MPKWTTHDQENLRSRRNQKAYQKAETAYRKSDRFYTRSLEAELLEGARAPGTRGSDDPGTLHQFRDPNIGTPEWYADKYVQPPEKWIERWELDPHSEGFRSVVVDDETGEVVAGSHEQLVVDTRSRSIGGESRVGTVESTGEG